MINDEAAKKNLAENVRRLLRDRGWSQAKLAFLAGEGEMQISRIVRGKLMPNVATVARIAEAFDVSIDRLVGQPPERSLEVAS